LIALVECQVAPDHALHKWCQPVEGSVAGDVREAVMDLYELVVPRRDDWCGQRQAELFESSFDASDGGEPNRLEVAKRRGKRSLPSLPSLR
jgi:hypothetical protein